MQGTYSHLVILSFQTWTLTLLILIYFQLTHYPLTTVFCRLWPTGRWDGECLEKSCIRVGSTMERSEPVTELIYRVRLQSEWRSRTGSMRTLWMPALVQSECRVHAILTGFWLCQLACNNYKHLVIPLYMPKIKCISFPLTGLFTHSVLTSYVEATQVFYAHRQYPNLLVMEVLLKRQRSSEKAITVELDGSFTPHSPDVAFEKAPDYKGGRYV